MSFFTDEVDSELLIVTQSWGRKECPDHLLSTLNGLSAKALARPDEGKIKVRICLTTTDNCRSLRSRWRLVKDGSDGIYYDHNPQHWTKELGIPHLHEIPGLDLEIRQIFMKYRLEGWEYKVEWIQPTFIIIDRKLCLIPSCHVVGPHWKDGCLFIRGPAVDSLVLFWLDFWEVSSTLQEDMSITAFKSSADTIERSRSHTLFLPAVIREQLLWRKHPPISNQPKNISFLFGTARESILIQASRIFYEDMIDAMREALSNQVYVHIVTSELNELMPRHGTDRYLPTITGVRRLIRWYEKVRRLCSFQGRGMPGRLCIDFFHPKNDSNFAVMIQRIAVIDRHTVVFGHGTVGKPLIETYYHPAQDIGVAFLDAPMASAIKEAAGTALKDRVTSVYDSESTSNDLSRRFQHSRLSPRFWLLSEPYKDAGRGRSAWLEPSQVSGT